MSDYISLTQHEESVGKIDYTHRDLGRFIGHTRVASYVSMYNPEDIYSIFRVLNSSGYCLAKETCGQYPEPVAYSGCLEEIIALASTVLYSINPKAAFFEVPLTVAENTRLCRLDLRRMRSYYALKDTRFGKYLSGHTFQATEPAAWVSPSAVYMHDLAGRLEEPARYVVKEVSFLEASEVPEIRELRNPGEIVPLDELLLPWRSETVPP